MGAIALSAGLQTAGAQTYPSRPERILVGYAAGGSADTLARLAAQWLSERSLSRIHRKARAHKGVVGNIAVGAVRGGVIRFGVVNISSV